MKFTCILITIDLISNASVVSFSTQILLFWVCFLFLLFKTNKTIPLNVNFKLFLFLKARIKPSYSFIFVLSFILFCNNNNWSSDKWINFKQFANFANLQLVFYELNSVNQIILASAMIASFISCFILFFCCW